MTRVCVDVFEDGAEAANDGDVFVRDKAHADGGYWQAPTGGSQAFPVGAVFIAVVATDPATLLGYGTWSAFGAGRVLVGLDSGDTDFDTVEETGGAKTAAHTHPAGTLGTDTFAAHSHGVGTLATVAESSHTHGVGTLATSAHTGTAVSAHSGTAVGVHSASDFNHKHDITTGGNATISAHSGTAVADHAAHTHAGGTYTVADHTHGFGTLAVSAHGSVSRSSGGNATASTNGHTISGATGTYTGGVAPSLAGSSGNPSATLTHSVTQPSNHTLGGGTELADGLSGATLAHSVTQPSNHTVTQPDAHTVSGSTGAGSSHSHTMSGSTASDGAHSHAVNSGSTGSGTGSIVQPYIVVHMWKRTA